MDLAAEAFKMYRSSPSHGEGDIPPEFRKAGAIFHHSLFSDLRALGVMGHVKQWPVVVKGTLISIYRQVQMNQFV